MTATSSAPVVRAGAPSRPTPRAWRRYWARLLDTLLGQLTAGLILGLTMPGLVRGLGDDRYLWYLTGCLITIPLEALLLAVFGTLPGKAALGLRVTRQDGELLTFGEGLSRAVQVWVFGLGIGFPIVCLFTMARAKANLERDRVTRWDRKVNAKVEYTREGT